MFAEYDVELLSAYQEKVEKHDFGKMCEDVRLLQEACKEIAKNSLHISTYEDVKNNMLTSIFINKELTVDERISFVYGMSEGKYYLSKERFIRNFPTEEAYKDFINKEANIFESKEEKEENKYNLISARAGFATKLYLELQSHIKRK
mgnify:FL=1